MHTTPFRPVLLLLVSLLLVGGCERAAEVDIPRAGDLESGPVVVLTDANFDREVLDSSQPVLVDFWAAWCRPCLEMKPVLRELATEYAGRAKFCELDVSDNQFTADKYGVHSVPALLLFRDGRLIERLDGRPTRKELVRLLEPAQAQVGRTPAKE